MRNCFSHRIEPVRQVKRWSRAKSSEMSVPQPFLIAKYNHGTGGLDQMDQNVQSYRIDVRCKKWWWQLFVFHVDAAMQNACLMYRQTSAYYRQQMSLVRRSVVQSHVMKYKGRHTTRRPVRQSKSLNQQVPTDARFHGKEHYLEQIQTQCQCANCGLKAKSVWTKCADAVHSKCFREFHIQTA